MFYRQRNLCIWKLPRPYEVTYRPHTAAKLTQRRVERKPRTRTYEYVVLVHGTHRNPDVELEKDPGAHAEHASVSPVVLKPGEHPLQLDAPAALRN